MNNVVIKNVGFTYQDSTQKTLSNIDLTLQNGEITVVGGPTGSGKSTLAYLLVGLIPSVIDGKLTGEISIFGEDPRQGSSELRGKVGYVAQHFENELFGMKVEEALAFGPLNDGRDRKEVRETVERLLSLLQLENERDQYSFHLSRGEQQKVVIGSMLATKPALLVLDEPFSQLDQKGKQHTLQMIKKLEKEEDLTILLIEHDLPPALEIAQRLVLINEGELVYDGPPNKQSNLLTDLGLRVNRWSETFSQRKANHTSKHILTVSNLDCYREGTKVLDQAFFTLRQGETVSIVGENGAGKTTFALACADLIPYDGTITREGNVSMMFQDPDANLLYSSVWKEVFHTAKNRGIPEKTAQKVAKNLLQQVGLFKYKHKHPQTLSQGQRLRLAFISAISSNPEILILDEPTIGQDFNSLRNLFSILQSFDTATMICTTHKQFAETISQRVYRLHNGKLRIEKKTDRET